MRFVVDELTLEQIFFFEFLRFPLLFTIPPLYSSHTPRCDRPHQAAHYHILRHSFVCFISSLVLRMSQSNKVRFQVSFDRIDVTYSKWNLNDLRDTVVLDVTPCSPVEVYPKFRRNVLLPSSVLKVSHTRRKTGVLAACLTNLNFYRTARSQIPEDSSRHNHHCDNFEFKV
jgi:hypothetical protein